MRSLIVPATVAMLVASGCADVEGTKARAIEEAKQQCEGHGKLFVLKNVEVVAANNDIAVRGYCLEPGEQVPNDIK